MYVSEYGKYMFIYKNMQIQKIKTYIHAKDISIIYIYIYIFYIKEHAKLQTNV